MDTNSQGSNSNAATYCLTMGKLLHHSVLQFCCQIDRDNVLFSPLGSCEYKNNNKYNMLKILLAPS